MWPVICRILLLSCLSDQMDRHLTLPLHPWFMCLPGQGGNKCPMSNVLLFNPCLLFKWIICASASVQWCIYNPAPLCPYPWHGLCQFVIHFFISLYVHTSFQWIIHLFVNRSKNKLHSRQANSCSIFLSWYNRACMLHWMYVCACLPIWSLMYLTPNSNRCILRELDPYWLLCV